MQAGNQEAATESTSPQHINHQPLATASINDDTRDDQDREDENPRSRKRRKGPPVKMTEPKPGACHFFLPQKGRFCTVKMREGSLYCGNHRPAEEIVDKKDSGGGKRIPCPLDPSHTIYEAYLNAHLKICNVTKDQQRRDSKPCFRAGVNSGPRDVDQQSGDEQVSTVDVPKTLEKAIALVQEREGLKTEVDEIRTGHVAEPILASIQANGWGFQRGRHVIQQASLLSHLNRRWPIKSDSTSVELGAGRGTLGQALHLAFPSAKVILVERSGVKHKADSTYRRTGKGSHFERHRIDIRDLYIKGLSLPPRPLFMGKHVCGVATDLALRSVHRFLQDDSQGARGMGLVIACCCYHCCSWEDYVGREIWEKKLGLGRAEFAMMKRTACWTTSLQPTGPKLGDSEEKEGSKQGDDDDDGDGEKEGHCWSTIAAADEDEGGEEEEDEGEHAAAVDVLEEEDGKDIDRRTAAAAAANTAFSKSLSDAQKLTYGLACKRLIDWGRLEYLRSAGLKVELVKYCAPSISPENACIIAVDPRQPTGEEGVLR